MTTRDDLGGTNDISRRAMLRRIGVGTAVAWSAPTVLSLGGRAMAQVASPVCRDVVWECGDPLVVCGSEGPLEACLCDVTAEGGDICFEAHFCGVLEEDPAVPDTCAASADCPSGWACVTTCCGPVCRPLCGEGPATASGGSGPSDLSAV